MEGRELAEARPLEAEAQRVPRTLLRLRASIRVLQGFHKGLGFRIQTRVLKRVLYKVTWVLQGHDKRTVQRVRDNHLTTHVQLKMGGIPIARRP